MPTTLSAKGDLGTSVFNKRRVTRHLSILMVLSHLSLNGDVSTATKQIITYEIVPSQEIKPLSTRIETFTLVVDANQLVFAVVVLLIPVQSNGDYLKKEKIISVSLTTSRILSIQHQSDGSLTPLLTVVNCHQLLM